MPKCAIECQFTLKHRFEGDSVLWYVEFITFTVLFKWDLYIITK